MDLLKFPILEFDDAPRAILNPDVSLKPNQIPKRAVLCFFQDVIQVQIDAGKMHHIFDIKSEMGKHPIYAYADEANSDDPIAVAHPGIGGPLAAGILEEMIQLGAKKIIACGGCGVLDDHVDVGHPFVVTSAVRDEGTSYHYLAPSREVQPHPEAVALLEETLKAEKIAYTRCKTWTTDAIYRETVKRRALRMDEGCEVVEMEAASFFAVAQFRKVKFGQLLYGGDLVKPEGWDGRAWHSRKDSRHLLFDLAVKTVRRL